MHHFNETETQWTYRGPWAFYFNLLLLLTFMKHTIYTPKQKLWYGIIIGGTNLSQIKFFISADP